MFMKKNEDEVVFAMVMPLANHSDEEVIGFLTDRNAKVRLLSEGFLSVKATRQTLESVESIARVEIKRLRKMH